MSKLFSQCFKTNDECEIQGYPFGKIKYMIFDQQAPHLNIACEKLQK